MFYDRQIKYLDYLENGDKIRNAGFVKIEATGDFCNIQINVNGLYPTDTIDREVLIGNNDRETGIGSLKLESGKGTLQLKRLSANGLGKTRIPYNELQYIRIPLAKSREVRCQWRGIYKPEFNETEKKTYEEASNFAKEDSLRAADSIMPDNVVPGNNEAGNEEFSGETISDKEYEYSAEPMNETEDAFDPEPTADMGDEFSPGPMNDMVAGFSPGLISQSEEGGSMEPMRNMEDEFFPEPMSDINEAFSSEPIEKLLYSYDTSLPVKEKISMKSQEEAGKDDGAKPIQINWMEQTGEAAAIKKQERAKVNRDGQCPCPPNNKRSDNNAKSPGTMARPYEEKWKQLSSLYPHVKPFDDEREYLTIGPNDFVILNKTYHRLVNNSFLLHGYFNYEHLILVRTRNRGEERFYVGVPGNFYEREKQVAVMFGFESFECKAEPAHEGDFGYYMIRVEI